MQSTLPAPHGYRLFHCCHCGNITHAPIHCTSKFCEPCTSSRRYRVRYRIQWALQYKPQTTVYRWRHITLTVRNAYNLEERINHLIRSFRNLRQRKLWKQTQIFGFYVIEITYGVGGWHPHLHVISYGTFIPIAQVKQNWWRITKDSYQAWITSIDRGTSISWYVTKYITKPSGVPENLQKTLDTVTKGRRMFSPFGTAARAMRHHKPPKISYQCPNCGSSDWIPDFLLQRYKRHAPLWHGAPP